MGKYEEVITQLKVKNVVFNDGLKPHEISEIEKFYHFNFPVELWELYSKGLPISQGFYNWRDKSFENINMLNLMLSNPIKEIMQDLHDGLVWCNEWGEKPEKLEDSNNLMMAHYQNAPKLIPIYAHRYIPAMEEIEKLPIFSVHGSDIIYYGIDLVSYLETEFGLKKHDKVNDVQYPHIPFWSDLI